MRLPPSVHGQGDHGFVPGLIGIARAKGLAAYVGDGSNRWAAVHRLDAARLFRLALQEAPAGARLHAVGDEGVPFRDIAAVIGRHLDLPVTCISREEADAHFGGFALFASIDVPASSAITQQRFGWHPVQSGLIADLDEGHYFTANPLDEHPDPIQDAVQAEHELVVRPVGGVEHPGRDERGQRGEPARIGQLPEYARVRGHPLVQAQAGRRHRGRDVGLGGGQVPHVARQQHDDRGLPRLGEAGAGHAGQRVFEPGDLPRHDRQPGDRDVRRPGVPPQGVPHGPGPA